MRRITVYSFVGMVSLLGSLCGYAGDTDESFSLPTESVQFSEHTKHINGEYKNIRDKIMATFNSKELFKDYSPSSCLLGKASIAMKSENKFKLSLVCGSWPFSKTFETDGEITVHTNSCAGIGYRVKVQISEDKKFSSVNSVLKEAYLYYCLTPQDKQTKIKQTVFIAPPKDQAYDETCLAFRTTQTLFDGQIEQLMDFVIGKLAKK